MTVSQLQRWQLSPFFAAQKPVLVLYHAGSWSNVLELTPSLIITREEIDRGVAILAQVLDDAIAGRVDAAKVADYAGW